jgi:hypothetical protein
MIKKLITISTSLDFLFEPIEEILNMKFREEVIETILKDFEEDQVNQKTYRLSKENNRTEITGFVDDYEPESILLSINNITKKEKEVLKEILENYEFAFGSGANFRPVEETIKMYRQGIANIIDK